MYCKHCGNQIDDNSTYCKFCGGNLGIQTSDAVSTTVDDLETNAAPATAVPIHRTPRLSVGGKVWCAICMLANALLIIYVSLMLGRVSEKTALIATIVGSGFALIGYLVLLTGNREGYLAVLLAATISLVFNMIAKSYFAAAFSLINPIITWFAIKGSWERMGMSFDKPKSRKVALILASIPHTGIFGVDKFYLGYFWLGLLKLLSCGGMLVWYVIDIIKIAKGTMCDKFGTPLYDSRKRP